VALAADDDLRTLLGDPDAGIAWRLDEASDA